MNYYDENAPFEWWARKWLKHKCIGMSFVYGRTLKATPHISKKYRIQKKNTRQISRV